jgi:hypothetical protein
MNRAAVVVKQVVNGIDVDLAGKLHRAARSDSVDLEALSDFFGHILDSGDVDDLGIELFLLLFVLKR